MLTHAEAQKLKAAIQRLETLQESIRLWDTYSGIAGTQFRVQVIGDALGDIREVTTRLMPKQPAYVVTHINADGQLVSNRYTLKGEAELRIANLLEDDNVTFTYRKVME